MKNLPVTNPPKVADESKVGEYDTLCFSGAGFIWDEVLEYRVWSSGPTECHTFASYDEAERFSEATATRSIVLALVKQVEYFEGNAKECAILVQPKRPRVCEWQVPWLRHDNHRPSMLERALRTPWPAFAGTAE